MYTCTFICISIYKFIYKYICIHIYVHIYTCIYTYIHIRHQDWQPLAETIAQSLVVVLCHQPKLCKLVSKVFALFLSTSVLVPARFYLVGGMVEFSFFLVERYSAHEQLLPLRVKWATPTSEILSRIRTVSLGPFWVKRTFRKVSFLIQLASSWRFQPVATGEFFVELRSIKMSNVLLCLAYLTCLYVEPALSQVSFCSTCSRCKSTKENISQI